MKTMSLPSFRTHATGHFLGCLLFLAPLLSAAQTPADSVRIAAAQWRETPVAPGAVWKQVHFDSLFDSQQEINLLEIDLTHPERQVAFAALADSVALTSIFAREADALGAINASFFNVKEGGSTTFVRIDGKEINDTEMLLPDGTNHERANGAIVIDGREVSIILGDKQTPGWDRRLKAANVLVCGPTLLQDGIAVILEKNAFNDNRHPRSAAAVTADNKLILLTADGRNAKAQGMNLHELAFLLRVMGMQDALNLDGGGSTALYVKGATESGIVNYPSDNKQFDHDGERKVANVILLL